MNKEQELKEALAFILCQQDMKDYSSARRVAFATLKKVYGPEWLPECPTFNDVDVWMNGEMQRLTDECIAEAKRHTE